MHLVIFENNLIPSKKHSNPNVLFVVLGKIISTAEHNFANYLFFLTHLLNKPDTEHTGQVEVFFLI